MRHCSITMRRRAGLVAHRKYPTPLTRHDNHDHVSTGRPRHRNTCTRDHQNLISHECASREHVIEAVSKAETTEEVVQRVANSLPATLIGAAVFERLRTLSILPTIEAAKRCGEFLQGFGFISHAETLFDSLASSFPERPAGLLGLAQI